MPDNGKSSSEMTSDEKTAEGYEYNESKGNWGEWRHYKNGTFGENCHGSGCTGLSPENASCWYSMAMPTEIQNRKSILTMPWRHKSILNKWVMKSV